MFPVTQKTKIISSIALTISLIFSCFLPLNSARAQVPIPGMPTSPGIPVMDVAVQANTFMMTNMMSGLMPDASSNPFSWENIFKTALKSILRQLTQSIVTWIDSGFHGSPAFITNTSQFLQDTADITIGEMLMGTDLDFLCDPFKIQLKLSLGFQYRPFQEKIRCTLSGALKNVDNALDDFTKGNFINNGGWDSWLQVTTIPQNNQMGAMILTQAELDARIQSSSHQAELEASWGGGFMSWKECTPATTGGTPGTPPAAGTRSISGTTAQDAQNCIIQTPGSVIANKINWVDSSTIRELELANDFNAIINALANQLLLAGLSSISGTGLLGSGTPRQSTAAQNNSAYLNQLQTQLPTSQNTTRNNTGTVSSPNQNNPINNQSFGTKASALASIDSIITNENQYLSAQNNIFSLLDTAQNIFDSSSCDANVTSVTTNQITGDYTGLKLLSWNKKDVDLATTTATYNLSVLNSTRSSVSAGSDNQTSILNLMQPIANLNTLHSASTVTDYSAGGNSFGNIKAWIQNQIDANRACVGNISSLSGWGIQ